jgi:hypothetical protein
MSPRTLLFFLVIIPIMFVGMSIALVVSLFERRAPGLFHNTAAVLDGQRGYAGKYRKMHIPDDPRFYEKYYFTPGDLGFKAFRTGAEPRQARGQGFETLEAARRERLEKRLSARASRRACAQDSTLSSICTAFSAMLLAPCVSTYLSSLLQNSAAAAGDQ